MGLIYRHTPTYAISSYTISDLGNFPKNNDKKYWNNKIFETCTKFFPHRMKVQRGTGHGRIWLGEGKWNFCYHYDLGKYIFWMSDCLFFMFMMNDDVCVCVCAYTNIHIIDHVFKCDLCKLWLAPDTGVPNYCISRGVSVIWCVNTKLWSG